MGLAKIAEQFATNVPGGEYTWNTPLSLATSIPNHTSGLGTVWVDTYNGGSLIGSTAQIPTFSLNLDRIKTNPYSYNTVGYKSYSC